jgi:L-alanine-DL-glutamate epimerase-like enolase superfamily enzyme
VDCALWDLECKRQGKRAWELAGMPDTQTVSTVYTLSLDEPRTMAAEALAHANYPILKLKLDSEQVLERLQAIRAARPDAQLLIDANGSWTADLLQRIGEDLAELGVAMVEQPLPRGADTALAQVQIAVPLYADESCQSLAEMDSLADRYQGVNIKLDKCGGLTEALAMLERAQQLGLETMVGNMLGSSLAMAPAFLVAQRCRWVDLDGPLWQRADHEPAMRFESGTVHPPEAALWG